MIAYRCDVDRSYLQCDPIDSDQPLHVSSPDSAVIQTRSEHAKHDEALRAV